MKKCTHENIVYCDGIVTFEGFKTVTVPGNSHFCEDCEKILIIKVKA